MIYNKKFYLDEETNIKINLMTKNQQIFKFYYNVIYYKTCDKDSNFKIIH